MAIYVFAMNPIKMIQGFIPIGQISVPKLSHKENVSKKELLRKMFMMFWVIVPLCLVLFAVAPMIYRIFFTKYDLAVPYFRAMILIVLFIPFSLLQAYLIAKKHAQELLRIRTITLTVRFVGFAILVPTLGLTGAVIAAIGVNTLSSILVLYYFLRVPSVIHEGQYVE
jgi:O-antigen/teichoic acid export membrane protein